MNNTEPPKEEFWTVRNTILVSVVAFIILAGGIISIMRISINWSEIEQRKQIEGENAIYKQNFDKTYKTCSQITQVKERSVDKNQEAFAAIYPDLISGRYKDKPQVVMQWIQESNPQWDMAAVQASYDELAVTIEAQRAALYDQETKLVDLIKFREAYVEKWGGFFISNTEKIGFTLISSKHTKDVFETGEDNDIDVFKNN